MGRSWVGLRLDGYMVGYDAMGDDSLRPMIRYKAV